ncbi:chromosome segregation protein Csm1/Pcs1-domain-containing protein [Terfezia claveryi]|nr:chromosome segregation protein Csm1/Pcs1-domain-containing protein [Terfezia claveryi]
MPSKRKTQQKPAQTLSDLIVSSDTEGSMATEAIVVRDDSKKKSTSSRQMPPKRAASKSRKPPPPQPTRKASLRGRKGAAEPESEPEHVYITENEEVDEIEEAEEVPVRRGSRPPPKAAVKKALPPPRVKKTGRFTKASAKQVVDGDEVTDTDGEASVTANAVQTDGDVDGDEDSIQVLEEPKKGKAAAAKKAPPKKMTKKEKEAQALAEKEIAETQYAPMDMDEEVVEEVGEVASAEPQKPASRKRAASMTQQPVQKKATPSIPEKLQGNTVGEEGLRKQLVEMTRRFEDTDKRLKELTKLKYTDAEVALVEYKKVMEARIATSEKLNAALQDDLNAYQNLGAVNKTLRKELAAKTTEISALKNKVTELQKNAYATQNEIQSLTAKLIVARKAAVAPQAPGSAVKPKGHSRDPPHMNGHGPTSSAGHIPWEVVAKEDLYGDLTALTVLGVKIFPDQPHQRVYDCIQTGKNGTLHFKLTTPVTMQSEEDEITFTPHLDPKRDAKILSLLPEYLTEEITFARQNATRFYLKLLGVVLRNEPGRLHDVETKQ